MSDVPAAAIAIPVVMGVIIVTAIVWTCVYNQTRVQPVRDAMIALVPIHLKPPGKDIYPESPEYQQTIRLNVQKDTQQKIQTRLTEEFKSDRGEPVWFTYQIRSGGQRHYSLLMFNYKFELVPAFKLPFGGGASFEGALQPTTFQRTIDEERRLCASTPPNVNGEEDTMLSLIGWTTKQHSDALAASDNAMSRIGTTIIRSKDEHKYFRPLASDIVTHRAEDYNWFLLCTTSKKQFVNEQPYAPPLGVAATWLRRMQDTRHELTPDQAAVVDQNVVRLSHYVSDRELDYVTQIIHADRRSGSGTTGRPSGIYTSSRGYGGGRIDWGVATGRSRRNDDDEGRVTIGGSVGVSGDGGGDGGGGGGGGGGGD